MLASTTNGIGIRQTSRSCQLTAVSTITESTISSALDRNWRRPIWTSSCSESMSEVMRDTITPAFSRS